MMTSRKVKVEMAVVDNNGTNQSVAGKQMD